MVEPRRSASQPGRTSGSTVPMELHRAIHMAAAAHVSHHHRSSASELGTDPLAASSAAQRQTESRENEESSRERGSSSSSATAPGAARFWEAETLRTSHHRPRPQIGSLDAIPTSAATLDSATAYLSGVSAHQLPFSHLTSGRTAFGSHRSNLPLQHQRLLDQQQGQQERQRRWYDQHLISMRRQQESAALQMHYGFTPPPPNVAPPSALPSLIDNATAAAGAAAAADAAADAASAASGQSARTLPLDWASQSNLINHHFRLIEQISHLGSPC